MLTNTARIEAVRRVHTSDPGVFIQDQALQKAQQLGRESDLLIGELDTATITIAEEYVKKIVEELVDNALKFSEAGTTVHVSAHADANVYVICVSDQGRGMTPAPIARIGAYMQFDRHVFEQQGSGLGLIITRRLVELHGGVLTIESVLNQQTAVYVTLPRG